MTAFSVPTAAFAGFKLIRSRPGSVLAWWAAASAFLWGIGYLGAVMAGEAFTAMREMQNSGAFDMTAYAAINRELGPYSAISTILQILFSAVITSAVLRALLRPVESGFAFLRLGMQEFRLAVTVTVIAIITSLAAAAVMVVGAIAGAVLVGSGSRGIGGVVLIVSVVLAVGVSLFLNIRFILAPPQTTHEKGVRIFQSWTLTKGYTGRLVATFLLFLLALLPFLLVSVAGVAAAGIMLDGVNSIMPLISYVTQPGFSAEEMLTPGRLIACVLTGFLWIMSSTLGLGMASNAYRQITGAEPVASLAGAADDDDDDDDDDDED